MSPQAATATGQLVQWLGQTMVFAFGQTCRRQMPTETDILARPCHWCTVRAVLFVPGPNAISDIGPERVEELHEARTPDFSFVQ